MSKRALLVIDLQNGVGPLYQVSELVEKVNARIAEFRRNGLPIIFIQHEDAELERNSKVWQILDTLDIQDSDHYVGKIHADSFYKTKLQVTLDRLKVNELEICGAEIPYCVDATIKAAFDRGYSLFMKHGLVSTEHDELIPVETLIKHYEKIWDGRFVTYLD